jgi:CubicO group peptidase (beta-lactamase class C family)
MRDRERGKPMLDDTIFRIYSMTKPITSVALMTLYEEGRFQLDDPVSRFLPELGGLRVWDDGTPLSFRTVPAERDITVRDLLTHTAGFTYGFMGRHPLDALYRRRGIEGRAVLAPQEGAPSADLAEMVGKLGELPLLFAPGSRWSYSVATDVCGHLIERLSGQRFDAFLSERMPWRTRASIQRRFSRIASTRASSARVASSVSMRPLTTCSAMSCISLMMRSHSGTFGAGRARSS